MVSSRSGEVDRYEMEGTSSRPESMESGPLHAERAAQTLGPLFSKVRRGLEKLLRECVTLEVALERNTEPHIMALLLPDYWADFIRSGPIEDVKPLGVGKP